MSNDDFDGTLDYNEARVTKPWLFEEEEEDRNNFGTYGGCEKHNRVNCPECEEVTA